MSGQGKKEDDLEPSSSATGYRVSSKKTLEELQRLDAHDESLQKWKASLGLRGDVASDSADTRRVIVECLFLQVQGRPDVVMDLSPEHLENQTFTLQEGVEYRLCIKFKVQRDVVSGLKYLHVVKRSGIRIDKTEEMLGSYGPSTEAYEKKFLPEEAPSGLLARGKYHVKSKFVDDDQNVHLEWTWNLEIKKKD